MPVLERCYSYTKHIDRLVQACSIPSAALHLAIDIYIYIYIIKVVSVSG